MQNESFSKTQKKELADIVSNIVAPLCRKLEQHDKRFDHINLKFDQTDKNFDHIHKKFDQIDKKFDQIDKRFDHIDKKFGLVDKRFAQIAKKFEEVDQNFAIVMAKFTRMDERFTRIDDRLRSLPTRQEFFNKMDRWSKNFLCNEQEHAALSLRFQTCEKALGV